MGVIQIAGQLLLGEHGQRRAYGGILRASGQRLSERIWFTRHCTGQRADIRLFDQANIRTRKDDVLKVRAAALRVTDMYEKVLAGLHETNFLNVDVTSLVFHTSDW